MLIHTVAATAAPDLTGSAAGSSLAASMYLGRVIGTVVANRAVKGLVGSKFLLVQPVDDQLQPNGPIQAAVDTVKAGPDDLVYLVGSREAALALEPWFVPVDAAIVGIVDDLYTPERQTTTEPAP